MFGFLEELQGLREGLQHLSVGPDQSLLVGEAEAFLLSGRGFCRVLEALSEAETGQARRTGQALVSLLGAELPPEQVLFALVQLRQRGYVVSSPAQAQVEAAWMPPRVPNSPIGLLCTQDETLEWVGEQVRDRTGPLLLVVPDGDAPRIGPLFTDDPGPCWQCLRQRRLWNQPVRSFVERLNLPSAWPLSRSQPCRHPAVLTQRLEQALLGLGEARGRGSPLRHQLLAWNPKTRTWQVHEVTRLPQCMACGAPEQCRVPRGVQLQPQVLHPAAQGGLRIEAADETWRRLLPQLSPLTGVVSSLGPVHANTERSGFVWAATFPTPAYGAGLEPNAFFSMAAGKGASEAQARMSALGEAIERHCALCRGDERVITASREALGAAAVDPEVLQAFSPLQLETQLAYGAAAYAWPDTRASLARAEMLGTDPAARGLRVPRPLDPARPIDWVEATALTQGGTRYLPAAWCFLRHPTSNEEASPIADSNGLAAGACLEEAILQGLLELVERDAVAMWWYHRARRPSSGLEDQPMLKAAVEAEAALGRRLEVLDLTHDLNIPVFCAVSSELERWVPASLRLGFGAHLLPEVALERALSELTQLEAIGERRLPWEWFPLEDHAFLQADPSCAKATERAGRLERARSQPQPLALLPLLEQVIAQVEARGLEVLVTDLTRPDIPLRVVRVVVPGLHPFWPRFRPGRLFEVPVALGWIPGPTEEAALNRTPLLL